MSTRCNVVVHQGKNHIYLYRHYDGYPAECGAVVAQALAKSFGHGPDNRIGEWDHLNIFMQSLLANQYDATDHSPTRPMYEFTNDLHGDIEYVYEINFNRDPSRMVRIAERSPEWHIDSDGDFAADRWTAGGAWLSLAGLIARVNRDRAECNKRLAELRKQSSVYKDSDDYPMLVAA